MKGRILNIVLVLVLATLPMAANAGWSQAQQVTDKPLPAPSQVEETPAPDVGFKSSPVMFIENVGQWDDGARFQVWGGPAGTMWLAEDATWITVLELVESNANDSLGTAADPLGRLSPDRRENLAPRRRADIKLSFVGANPHLRIEAFNRLETTISYFYGNDPEQWEPDVPVWGGVRYVDLYPGVDLVFRAEGAQLAARPGADLDAVALRIEGAEAATLEGDILRLSTAAGDVRLPLLNVDGAPTAGARVTPRGAQAFEVSAPFTTHSPGRRTLADDPTDLLDSTFLGGSGGDRSSYAIAVDGAGRAYVAGGTESSDFPTTPGAFDTSFNGGYDAFVAKLDLAGSALTYATFLGGSDGDLGYAIIVDGAGSAYVTGQTSSSDLPTTPGTFDPSFNGGYDAFVAKLSPTGSALAYSTFLGGNQEDVGLAMTVDAANSAYVTGQTYSSNFPTTSGAFDTSYNGVYDAFVAKLNLTGTAPVYATFLGGSTHEGGSAIRVDGAGSAYVTGFTQSSNFPTTPGAFDTSYNGNGDAFVTKLNAAGSTLAYATFLGGSSGDSADDIAVDGEGDAYLIGGTYSTNFPTTPGAFDTSLNGYQDAFITKLNAAGSTLAYATFLGSLSHDYGIAIAVDGAGSAYVTGRTESGDFPTTPSAFDTSYNGGADAFVVKLNLTGSALAYATFLGGSSGDEGYAIAVAGTDNAYVTGNTWSTNFPTTPGAFDTSYNGNGDTFLARLAMGGSQPCCDFDGDGTVGVGDLVILGGLWNQPATAPYDQDGDGLITIVDIQRVARWWGWPIP